MTKKQIDNSLKKNQHHQASSVHPLLPPPSFPQTWTVIIINCVHPTPFSISVFIEKCWSDYRIWSVPNKQVQQEVEHIFFHQVKCYSEAEWITFGHQLLIVKDKNLTRKHNLANIQLQGLDDKSQILCLGMWIQSGRSGLCVYVWDAVLGLPEIESRCLNRMNIYWKTQTLKIWCANKFLGQNISSHSTSWEIAGQKKSKVQDKQQNGRCWFRWSLDWRQISGILGWDLLARLSFLIVN